MMEKNKPDQDYIYCDYHGEIHGYKVNFYEIDDKDEKEACCHENWRHIYLGEAVPAPLSKKSKLKKMTPFSQAWEKAANEVARCRVTIHPCADCHGPVEYGYICGRCGSDNPGRDDYDEWTYL